MRVYVEASWHQAQIRAAIRTPLRPILLNNQRGAVGKDDQKQHGGAQ